MAAHQDETSTGTASTAEQAGPKVESARAEPEASPPLAAAGRRRFRYTLPGAWVALVFTCLAFTPSLLPRSALLQGVVCGISAAIGYGVGVAGAWTWRAFADRDPRPPRPGAWRVFAISAGVALLLAFGLGQWWQAQLRDLMGAPTPNPLLLPLLPLAAVAIFTGLVALSRSLRGAYHRVAGRLRRWMGPRAANALGWAAVVVGTWLVASGLLLNGLAAAADRSFSVRNTTTPIVWWGPSLLWDRPDWLAEPPGRDVLDAMVWMPVVTFWQVTVDLPLATGVPDGHGHTYTAEFVDGWAAILQLPGWTPAKAERLRDIITASE